MASLLQTIWQVLLRRKPKLVCDFQTWNRGIDELRRRANGRQESGAFLLGDETSGYRRIREFLFYDDVDPTCFANGFVEFNGRLFGKVWGLCRERKLTVVADVHVHPGHYAQSPSDQQNPMIAEAGHLALIIPDFAARARLPGAIGLYQYEGRRRWRDLSRMGRRVFHVGWWPT